MAPLGERARIALRARARGVAAAVELALACRAPSVDVKLKLALVDVVGSAGLAVIDVSGAAVSYVNERLFGVSAMLTLSVARTRMV